MKQQDFPPLVECKATGWRANAKRGLVWIGTHGLLPARAVTWLINTLGLRNA